MTDPAPNPDWRYSPPLESKDGRHVQFDAMVWPNVIELYRILGVKPVEPNPRSRR